MKIVRNILLLTLLSSCFVTFADNITFQGFYKQLGDALSKRNTERIVDLLGDLDGSAIWSFGAGVGPVDADYLQCVAVNSAMMIKDESLWQGRHIVSDQNKKWHDAFSISPTNISLIVQLLQDPKPAVRLIALRKLEEVQQIDSKIMRRLESVGFGDPYVRIVKQPIKISGNVPPPPGLAESDIVFPLRVIAREILLRKGCIVKYKAEDDASEGVRYFAKQWINNPQKREDIQEAISLLGSNGYGARAIKELAETEKDASVYLVFRQLLER